LEVFLFFFVLFCFSKNGGFYFGDEEEEGEGRGGRNQQTMNTVTIAINRPPPSKVDPLVSYHLPPFYTCVDQATSVASHKSPYHKRHSPASCQWQARAHTGHTAFPPPPQTGPPTAARTPRPHPQAMSQLCTILKSGGEWGEKKINKSLE